MLLAKVHEATKENPVDVEFDFPELSLRDIS
jgi:hypothetical protein